MVISVRKALIGCVLACMFATGCGKGPKTDEQMKGTEANRQAIMAELKVHYEKQGSYPATLQPPFYGGKLTALPPELFTNQNRVVPEYDGQGGWMYNSKTGEVFANVP